MTVSTPAVDHGPQVLGGVDGPDVHCKPHCVGPLHQLPRPRTDEGMDGPEARPRRLGQGGLRLGGEAPQGAERQAAVGGLHGPQRRHLEGRHDHPRRPARLVDGRRRERRHGLAGVPPGVLGGVLDLDVDHHALADRQHVSEQRHMGRQVGHLELGDGPDPGDLGVVVDGQGTVGGQAHVELDAVGAQAPGLGEGVDGVLGEPLACNPYVQRRRSSDPRHLRRHDSTVTGAETFTKNSLPGLPADRYPLLR